MKIGVIQICSTLEPEVNLSKIKTNLQMAQLQGVEAVFLPECFYSMSDGTTVTPYVVEHGNEHYENIKALATKHKLFILGGSAATLENGQVYNRSYNFDKDGNDLGHYDKINLFSCDIKGSGGNKVINENDIYAKGDTPKIIEAGDLKIGLSLCFDIRFPQMYRTYAQQGVNLLSIPSAFTVPSGRSHWHTLVRARAIENQCFVVAPAQWGRNNDKIQTYGYSMIVDPWGEVLSDAKEGEKLIIADLDLSKIEKVRSSIKVFD